MGQIWSAKTDAEIIVALDRFAGAQELMATNVAEDHAHWYHMASAHLYDEAAIRLRKAWRELHVLRTTKKIG
jgi:hypothetical protein